jgi:hypothetical protein
MQLDIDSQNTSSSPLTMVPHLLSQTTSARKIFRQ